MMELRDSLAAQIAASLTHSTLSPRDIARRAYAVADAMLVERAEPCFLDEDDDTERLAIEAEAYVEPSHDPRWELSPRWSREDLAALEARRRGPGLVKSQRAVEELDAAEHEANTG